MKASRLSSILFGAILLCAVPLLAGNTVKKSLDISETVSVHGTQLLPGTYRFEWSGNGPEVQLTILHNHDTLATVPAQVVQQNSPNDQTGYALKKGPAGEQDLSEVFFSGQKYQLELQGQQDQTTGASPSR